MFFFGLSLSMSGFKRCGDEIVIYGSKLRPFEIEWQLWNDSSSQEDSERYVKVIPEVDLMVWEKQAYRES